MGPNHACEEKDIWEFRRLQEPAHWLIFIGFKYAKVRHCRHLLWGPQIYTGWESYVPVGDQAICLSLWD